METFYNLVQWVLTAVVPVTSFAFFAKQKDPVMSMISGESPSDPIGSSIFGGGASGGSASAPAPAAAPQSDAEATSPQPKRKKLTAADTALTSPLGAQGDEDETQKRQLFGA